METTDYALGRTEEENERVRAQARLWSADTARLLDLVGLGTGDRCLDAGCGPGETMRLMAERVGPSGEVTGIDLDPGISSLAPGRVIIHDLTADDPVPGGPYDLVHARLLLFHTPRQAEVLRRLWDAVAPGGHLVVQDYDLSAVGVNPPLDIVDEMTAVLIEAFGAAGCDVRAGSRLPYLMAEAGIGAPDGTDVAGRLVPVAVGTPILESVYVSLLPVAYAKGLTTPADAEKAIDTLRRETAADPDRYVLLPLLNGVWKTKGESR
ncbi:class I SAM-dependent methyltransferase [Actinoplanes sp. HUAS TT8]|uniref:class I SAM-dependent methyltransferase n=1 Tax=Actinoplanes sp. HUAS TT8 TaxID=3447453 RepID=UPI003F51BAD6